MPARLLVELPPAAALVLIQPRDLSPRHAWVPSRRALVLATLALINTRTRVLEYDSLELYRDSDSVPRQGTQVNFKT